ncbi:GNAT family N-acetyltransferase [Lacticaseibacillus zeae]|uniref:GNAT family N-acetyltransferase n=1 Tax=Lacticaseibacillus zeae subsp. silagei TaxID=3068307 RepID=A0ABD7Z8I8_LACZE|nr:MULTISPECIES: GNAT family N-acetyltransferase [Lacticaseibacillus]MDE3316486.1 N-acetyltransferase family protein [Lacticaseibacillus zeae]OFR96843.1 acetyltransferase [Lactobacillus sp. HMSC068F07]WLV83285.1 GNAT family N-acetyltransferase [Lacticaseibacillus sp. NCIMB 15475]WLV86034.1 GNAT family N-acetyltransferase [Lacticaseibacillus sp. NCIMB 15474]
MIEFKPATAADLPKIVAIYNETIPTHRATADLQPQTVAQKSAWLAAHNAHFPAWVIQNHHETVGWLTLSAYSDRAAYDQTAEISLYLDQAARGHHVGTAALAFVDHEAPAHGLTTVIARIFGHNQASRHLFQKFGYDHWGHLPAIATLPEGHADLEVYGKHFGI